MTDVDESLREQSKLLLRKLKEKQGRLQNIVLPSEDEQPNSETFLKQQFSDGEDKASSLTNVKEQMDSSLFKTGRQSTKNVRSRLHQRSRSKEDKENFNFRRYGSNGVSGRDLPNSEAILVSDTPEDKQVELESLREAVRRDMKTGVSDAAIKRSDAGKAKGSDKDLNTDKKETPSCVRRRKIIDRNVKVDAPIYANLDASALIRECEDEMPKLNYSYTDIEDSDLKFLQKRLGGPSSQDGGQVAVDVDDDGEVIPERDTGTETSEKYSVNLENPGNNRKFAKFIRDVKKPKSILLSNSQRSNRSSSGNTSKVSFRSPTRDSSSLTYQMDSMSKQNHKMMGYDWIAALLDNDSHAVNQSETFFEELKEFRKVNLDECVNNVYMDGPMELWEHPEREPSPVQKALEETRPQEVSPSEVKPYTINDRLFAEPIQRSLFAQYDYQEPNEKSGKQQEGTYDEPRFVRVSIPRSTLMAAHHVKPHRRNSFDAADTMSLSRHCLKGWNNSQPTTMPAATNIALRDSTLGIKSALKTTLHDAEKLAANYPYEWNASEQSFSQPKIKPLYRPETNYMNGTWPYNVRDSSATQYTEASSNLNRATDDLLNSTYSLMYEMKRLKNERSDHPLRV